MWKQIQGFPTMLILPADKYEKEKEGDVPNFELTAHSKMSLHNEQHCVFELCTEYNTFLTGAAGQFRKNLSFTGHN